MVWLSRTGRDQLSDVDETLGFQSPARRREPPPSSNFLSPTSFFVLCESWIHVGPEPVQPLRVQTFRPRPGHSELLYASNLLPVRGERIPDLGRSASGALPKLLVQEHVSRVRPPYFSVDHVRPHDLPRPPRRGAKGGHGRERQVRDDEAEDVVRRVEKADVFDRRRHVGRRERTTSISGRGGRRRGGNEVRRDGRQHAPGLARSYL